MWQTISGDLKENQIQGCINGGSLLAVYQVTPGYMAVAVTGYAY